MSDLKETIMYNNSEITVITNDNVKYVAMKPICEAIGLDWSSQRQSIRNDEVLDKVSAVHKVPTKGGPQDMLMLPLDYVNGWLFSISVNHVRPEIKDKLIQYKRECYRVLANHFVPKAKFELNELGLPNLNTVRHELAFCVKSYHMKHIIDHIQYILTNQAHLVQDKRFVRIENIADRCRNDSVFNTPSNEFRLVLFNETIDQMRAEGVIGIIHNSVYFM